MANRPIERRVLTLSAAGLDNEEIGRRFKRSAAMIARLIVLAELPQRSSPLPSGPSGFSAGSPLRPLERRVLRWREAGATPEEIGARFRRSPEHMRRVERYARHKLEPGLRSNTDLSPGG